MSSEKTLNAYRGVLRNKKLGKILNDGFNAPVGSTKRKHAQRIMSIVNKTSIDGAGGPGQSIKQPDLQLQQTSHNYGNMVVFPATPKVRVPIGSKAPAYYPGSMDGKGGPSSPFGGNSQYQNSLVGGGLVLPQSQQNNGLNNFTGVTPGAQQSYGGNRSGLSLSKTSPFGNSTSSAMKNTFGGTSLENMMRVNPGNDILKTGMNNLNVKGNPQQTKDNNIASGFNSNADVSNKFTALGNGVMGAFGVPLGKKEQKPPVNTQQETPQFDTLKNQVKNNGVLGVPQDTPQKNTELNTSGSLGTMYPNIQSSVDSNIGPSMFAYQAINKGSDYLKSLPGMDGVPESILKGGTLADRLKTLDGTLQKQYNLDQLLNNYTDLVKNGANIEGQMTNYIRGRDEFLNETNGMIDDITTAALTMDTSDPRTQANMQNNLNYLYEMKGRQNQRYVDFLKMSIDEYSTKVSAAENIYKTRFNEYSSALSNDAAITTEQYNTMYTGLQEMYATVADSPLVQLQLLEAQGKLLSTYGDIGGDTSSYTSKSSGAYKEQYKTMTSVNTLDKDGRWVNNPNAIFSGGDPTTFVQIMENGVYQAVTQQIKEGDFMRQPNQREIGDTIGNALGHLALLQQSGQITQDAYNRSLDKIQNMGLSAIGASGVVKTDQVSQYRDAINSLDGKQPWLWFNTSTPKKQDFLTKYPDLNQQILGGLYDQMQIYINQGEGKTATDWVQTKLSGRGALGQGSGPLTDSELRNVLLKNFTNSFQAQEILPSTQSESPTTQNRPQRNNNPLNLKFGDYTKDAPGVTGTDPVPPTDGGNPFLTFDTPESGYNAAKKLFLSPLYINLNVSDALELWSNNKKTGKGYDGSLVPSLSHKMVRDLTDAEVESILQKMAQQEGYYA